MNDAQQSYVLEAVQDFLIGSKNTHAAANQGVVDIKGYSSPKTSKVVIRVTSNADHPVAHIVFDYDKQVELEDCTGVIHSGDENDIVKLNCDGHTLRVPKYRVDDTLTEALRERFMPAE